MPRITYTCQLEWSQLIAPRTLHLGFKRLDEAVMPFVPGQFITLHLNSPDKTKILHRSYSIANAPGKKEIEIACSYVEGGVASEFLFNLKPGMQFEASGPYGLFVLKKEEMPKRYIFVATGTGVSPYRSMLDELKTRMTEQAALEAVVVLGVRNPQELLFREELIKAMTHLPNFKFHACYSQEMGEKPLHFETKGRVQAVFPALNLNPRSDVVYLCGNPNMIDESFELLTQQGFDKKNVRREKYVFSH